ncbi:cytochrome P450 4g15-like isoform X2 [Planococcus citri]
MTILTQSHDRDTLGFANEWIGNAILTAKYEDWKKSRKILAPAFSSQMLSKYTDVFNEKSSALVHKFKEVVDTGEVIDVWDHLIKTNIYTIVENSIGVSINNIDGKGEKFGDAAYEALENVVQRVITPWLHPRFIYQMYLKITGKNRTIEQLYHLPTKILKEKMTDYENGNYQFDDVDSSKLIIDQIIKGGMHEASFTESRMSDELLQIIGAAMETTALNVCFTLLMLAIHQDIQQKVYEEIIGLLADDEKLTPNHLFNELKYMEQCIKETSRMYSQVVATLRRTHKECVLKDNKIVPANTLVFLAIHWAQHDKDMYKNPFKWDPEHFSEEAEQNRPKNSLLSFGYGPRSCLGSKYAMMSIKTQISYILRNYHLSTNVEEFTYADLHVDIAIRSKIGYPIKFTSRQKSHQ